MPSDLEKPIPSYSYASPEHDDLVRALSVSEKELGPDHPSTARSLNNLAILYNSQGLYEEALPLFQRALTISEQALGPDHPDVALSLNNLASLFLASNRKKEAEHLLERAARIMERALGPDHPLTKEVRQNLEATQ